jgi:hypothetical protein
MFSSTNPAGGVAGWTSVTGVDGNAPIAALVCPDASLCVAEDVATDMVTTIDPTGPASAWVTFTVDTSNHESGGVSCPSPSLCVAVGGQDVVTSVDP